MIVSHGKTDNVFLYFWTFTISSVINSLWFEPFKSLKQQNVRSMRNTENAKDKLILVGEQLTLLIEKASVVLAMCYANILLKVFKSFPKVWKRINWKRLWPRATDNEECSRILKMQTHRFADMVPRRNWWVIIASVLFLPEVNWHLICEVNLRNNSILNSLVVVYWGIVCFEIQLQRGGALSPDTGGTRLLQSSSSPGRGSLSHAETCHLRIAIKY